MATIGKVLRSGEFQMLAMTRIIVAHPLVVLIDKRSKGLAPMIVAEIFAIIRQMREADRAVLLVEQYIHEALAVCDRFVAVKRGQIVLEGHPGNTSDW